MKKIYLLFLFIVNVLLTKSGFSQGDECYSALTLTNVSNYCSNTPIYTNVGSTSSGLAVASCWAATATSDVWFSYTATGTDVLISVNGNGFGGTIIRPRIALYFGTCNTTSTSVNQLGCNNGTAGSGFSQLYVGGLILGQTYLIRISSLSTNVGTFELCVNNYNPPPSASADCGGAGKLCNKNPISVGTLSGGGANPNEPSGETGSCMEGGFFNDAESNSVWYTWTCGTSGTLLFDLSPLDPTNDIDYVFYQLSTSNPCGARTIIRCNTSSCLNANGSTGLNATDADNSEDSGCDPGENAYCQQINMVAGTSYAILINNADGNSGFNINWGGTGTFLGPDPNIIASDTVICAGGSITFDGASSTNFSSLDWTFNATGSPVLVSGAGPHSVLFSNNGTYVAILKANSALGCSSVEYKNIIVGSSTISVTSASICSGKSAVLSASGASSYTWSTGALTSTISVSPTLSTNYTVTGGVGTCTNTQIASLSVSNPPTGVSAGPSSTLSCVSNSVSLIGSIVTPTNPNVNWTGASVCGITTSLTSLACTAGVYTLTVTDPSNGCSATSTVEIYPNAGSPIASITSTSLTVDCNFPIQTATVTVTPLNNITYNWSPSPLSVSSLSVASFNTQGTFVCTVTNTISGCTSTVQTVVAKNTTLPSVVTSNTVIPCNLNSIDILSVASPTNVTYTWTTLNGTIVSGETTGTVNVSSAGNYVITVKDNLNGCVNTATSNVTTASVTAAFTANPQSGTAPLSVNFTDNSTGAATYTYNFADGNTSNIQNAINTFTLPGVYTVTLTVEDVTEQCSSSATLTIIVNENSTLIIPNVFTPNGDGSNDVFKIKSTGIKDLTVDIFNRWGTKLYTIASVNDSWDGGNSSDGTYFFVLKAIGFDGKEYTEKGFISLFK